ncbi:MAG: MaoC family dehydratase N-terminal domain-containing protein [Cystobacterineae bacterium]|nr:MaoC family dehydratase N-terminal domain-containing protein [Cystobacterineae bacterium]
MYDKSELGKDTPAVLNEIEKGAIRRFAESLGDYNPIYYDEKYAQSVGLRGIVAPPTFPFTFQLGADLRERLNVPAQSLLHAETQLEYERPIFAGDKLWVSSRLIEFSEKRSPTGKFFLVVIEDEGKAEDGKRIYSIKNTYIIRGVKSGRPGAT